MNHTSKIAGLLFSFFCLLTTVNADPLDEFVRPVMEQRKIPGISITVLQNGKVLRESSYGFANLELRVPASSATVYEIGSISKQFASEAIMLLVEDGKIKLDDPITIYLPANAPETWLPITVRDLLNHTSGLKDWTEVKEFSYRREYSAAEFIDLVKGFPLNFKPKDNWAYSNTNLPLVGIIVEKASGKTFEDFVNERIFARLKLPSIRFKHQDQVVTDRASGYNLVGDTLRNGEPFRPKVIAASGGIMANATDLARWWDAVLTGRVVKQSSLDEMLALTELNDLRTVPHGFAFFIDTFNGHKVIQHFGSTVGGFGSIVRYYPKKGITIVVIGNLGDGGFGAEYIAKRVSDKYIPGSFVGGLKNAENTFPGQTPSHLATLKAIAEKTSAPMLSDAYVPKISDVFRKQLANNLAEMTDFKFLGREIFSPEHFMLDPTAAGVDRYKMTLKAKTVYYHLRFNKERKISWISTEE